MPIDIAAVRADTPGCLEIAHLNNAGASLMPTSVLTTVIDYLEAEARLGGYEVAAEREEQLDAVYTEAAAMFGGAPNEWAFLESATRGFNAAFSALRFQPGDRVLTTTAEYPSNMAGLLRATEIQGVEVVVVPDDDTGQVDVAALESLLDDRTRLVSVTHVPTQGGLVNPAEQVGALLRDTPILYQLDACQSVGQLPVNVSDIGCDIMSFTGRKFLRGPRCTGMVWVNDRALDQMGLPAGVDMRGATWDAPLEINPLPTARRFEPYEVFYAGKVGLAAALAYAQQIGVDAMQQRNAELAGSMRSELENVAGVEVHDQGSIRSAIVSFTVAGVDAADVQRALRSRSVNVSVTSVGSARLDFPRRNLTDIVRASVHYYNTLDEISSLIDVVETLAA